MKTRRLNDATMKGPVQIGDRTKDLIKQLHPGDIAVIAHQDIDRIAAEGLVSAGVAAVINTERSISGRYPNGGPIRIVRAGIPLLDCVGESLFETLQNGQELTIRDNQLLSQGQVIAVGTPLTVEEIEREMEQARQGVGEELRNFARNTLEYIQEEAPQLFAPLELPPIQTPIQGRHALVVVRGLDYKQDLRALRPYIREYQPVLIAVDGGADALLEAGFTPEIIVGDFDSLSERAVRCGAELVHHVHRDGRAPGKENLEAWGVPYHEFVIDGMSEDSAMLLAYESGATLIVAVGTHATMVEFLDKGRRGMSSTFLTRLRLGPVLVDAKGVNRLYEGRVRRRDIGMLVGAALIAMLVVTIVSEPLHVFWRGVWLTLRDFWFNFTDTF